MTNTWRAEDIPAYQIDGSGRRPKTDIDAAMSMPNVLVKDATREDAHARLLAHLTTNREYAKRYNEEDTYTQAMEAIADGANMVRVGGRAYRIRDLAACDKGHGPYQNCAACFPEDYPKFGRIAPYPES